MHFYSEQDFRSKRKRAGAWLRGKQRQKRHGGRVNGSPPIISSNFSADKQQHSRPNHHDERQRSARRSGWRRKQPQTQGVGGEVASKRGQRASNERARRSIRTAGLVCVHQGGRVRENFSPSSSGGGRRLHRKEAEQAAYGRISSGGCS